MQPANLVWTGEYLHFPNRAHSPGATYQNLTSERISKKPSYLPKSMLQYSARCEILHYIMEPRGRSELGEDDGGDEHSSRGLLYIWGGTYLEVATHMESFGKSMKREEIQTGWEVAWIYSIVIRESVKERSDIHAVTKARKLARWLTTWITWEICQQKVLRCLRFWGQGEMAQ